MPRSSRQRHFYELKRHWDPEAQHPDTATVMSRFYVDYSIAGVFITLLYLICLVHVFSKL